MEKEQLQIVAKLGVKLAAHQLETIANQVKLKNPSHEMIETNLTIAKDLNYARLYIVELENDLGVCREVSMQHFRLNTEKDKEIETLKKQLAELKDLL
jgi:hypothetical protein